MKCFFFHYSHDLLNCNFFTCQNFDYQFSLNITSVSNGTGQCNFSGQRDRSFLVVPGQRDNGTSSKSCHRTGRDFDSLSRPGMSRESLSKSRPVPSHGKNLSLSRCPFVPGQLENFCPFVPKSCTVPSRCKH